MLSTAHLEIVKGDITLQHVDAIVNAANTSLLGGSGVDGAIHKAAGPDLLSECKSLGGCPTSQARITGAYQLPSKYIIHTVGPVWSGGNAGEEELLKGCYRNSLHLAQSHDLASIAFPAISTGAYRFPPDQAAAIAMSETMMFLEQNSSTSLKHILFVCFDTATTDLYQTVYESLF